MPHALVLDAGGTISATPGPDGALGGGGALADALGEHGVGLTIERVYSGLSEEMNLAQARAVAAAALAAADRPDVDGVVVAHGTDTMEETAFLADLQWTSPKPVVFTGAQRAPGEPGFDGLDNLRDALALARSPQTRDAGAWIVFGGLALPARGAFKRHTSDLAAFSHRLELGVPVAGPLPRPRRAPPLPPGPCDERVDLIGLGLGANGRMIDAAVAGGERGLVLQGLGRGNAGPAVAEAVARAIAAGVALVVTSRCPEGEVSPDYATGRRLADAGAVFCDDLSPGQARILLARLLALHGLAAPALDAFRAWLGATRA